MLLAVISQSEASIRCLRPPRILGPSRSRFLPVSLCAALWLVSVALPSARAAAGFTALAPSETGVTFTNLLSEQRHLTNQILLNGAGVAAGDVDNDGLADVYFSRLDGANALYRNLGGWRFTNITEASGVALPDSMSTGCALADLNGDGSLDLVVNSLGQGTRIFFNDGKGRFRLHPQILNEGGGGMSLAIGDLDGDGYLDLYIANYRTQGLMDIPNARATFKRGADGQVAVDTFNGKPATAPELAHRFSVSPQGAIQEHGQPDVIYRNVHGTNFTALSWTDGSFLDEQGQPLREPFYDWGLAAMIRDVNGDGRPDIYVCNDFQTPDRFWVGQGAGKFRLISVDAQRKSSFFSMSVDFADFNRDGFDDFLVADMLSRSHAQRMRDMFDPTPPDPNRPQFSLNTLFLNRGDFTFAEIARFSGLAASEWTWSCVFLDVDLDGYEDVLFSNGMERAARDLDIAAKMKAMRAARTLTDAEIFDARRQFPRLGTANLAFRNRGDLTFEESGRSWGFDLAGVSHGLALADFDNDGDLDLALNNLNAPATLYRNNSDAPRVAIRLKSSGPNTRGIGARIVARGGAVPSQSQTMIAGGRYLSSDDPIRSFAAGSSESLAVEVIWPSGRRSEVNAAPGTVRTIEEPLDQPIPPRMAPDQIPTLFEDQSARLAFEHQEDDFDDYARQPLLPRKLSQQGPGAAWYDIDGDGWDDLFLGASVGGKMRVYRNLRDGNFQAVDAPAFKTPLTRDSSAIVGWRGAPGRGYLLTGFSNYEDGQTTGAAVKQLDVIGSSTGDLVAPWGSAIGALALADIDGDGDLDLFAAGAVVPAKYPAAASSHLLRNEGGRLVIDATNEAVFKEIGLVNGAVFTDLDGDKDQDLVLACEWGSIHVLRNSNGVFQDVTGDLGLAQFTGLWTGVAVGDFDEDGLMDIVAGNWGRNTDPKPSSEHPLRIYHGDLDRDGTYDIIESHFDPDLQDFVPDRQWTALSRSLGFIRTAFASSAEFSTAPIDRVIAAAPVRPAIAEASWLPSTVFLNRGDYFQARALPDEAQFAPAFGVTVADFDGDGHDDIVLAQNFFPMQPETPRQDAGRGLLLRGDGQGHFHAVPGQESGIRVYGEQRAAAAGDYDRDGRVDLLITQNGGAARLLHNSKAEPGLRVECEGAASNPDAIGASLRFHSGGAVSPRREIHSSSGWLTQNSRVQIFRAPAAGQLEIRWPDGLEEKIDIPADVKQVRLRREAPKTEPKK